jgi:hypothetical protein
MGYASAARDKSITSPPRAHPQAGLAVLAGAVLRGGTGRPCAGLLRRPDERRMESAPGSRKPAKDPHTP